MTFPVAKRFTLVASTIWTASAVLSVEPLLMTPRLFEVPGASDSAMTVTLALSIVTFPIVCLLAIALCWSALYIRSYELAIAGAWLPLSNLLVASLAIVARTL